MIPLKGKKQLSHREVRTNRTDGAELGPNDSSAEAELNHVSHLTTTLNTILMKRAYSNFISLRLHRLAQISILFLMALFWVSMTLCLASCAESVETGTEENHAEHDEHGDEDHGAEGHEGEEHEDESEGVVHFTATGMKEAEITLEKVRLQPVTATITAPGHVVATDRGRAHAGTMIAGRVTKVYVSEGSYVARGATLAEIEAVDIGRLKGEYARAVAEVEFRRDGLARQEKLAGEGIGAGRNREEAAAAYAQAVAAEKSAAAELRALGIPPSSVRGTPFSSVVSLRSPISGIIVRRNVHLGEHIDPDVDAFEILDNSRLWVDAQVSPAIASTISVGRAAFVRSPDGDRRSGQVIYISPTVDPDSRTVTVRLEINNSDRHLRPETFVSVEFEKSSSINGLVVPAGALEREGSRYFVYRQEEEVGTFRRVEVVVAGEGEEEVVVEDGLKEGDEIAVSGIFYLRSARLKGELQEHHH